ncbi:MAG: response regulator transcription factor [Lachnospiraceae bacterium]|nr:response regulator transcription factor [Lachnospiraceae bacterium]
MKILIAEDTTDMNRAVTVLLQRNGYDVDSAFDGEEAEDYIMHNGYDAIILDIMMPKRDGITVLKNIRASHIITPVLLLTAKVEIDDRVEGLDAGADDYLTKPFAMKELLARIRALVRRKSEYSADNLSYADIKLDAKDFSLTCENSVRLSVKEFELLQTLILNSDKTLSSEYILEHVWRDTPNAGVEVIKLYVLYLVGKLRAVASQLSVVGDAENGYRLEQA